MVAPAPVSALAEKLAPSSASSEEVLVVALLHASAHGASATELAPLVAALFEHPSASVQWHAMRAFLAVGRGSAASVPVLSGLLARGEPPVLVTRALAGLRHVGGAARAAFDEVLACAKKGAPRSRAEAIEALAAIAPDEPATFELLVEALHSDDFDLRLPALRVLDETGDTFDDRVLDDATRHLTEGSAALRVALASAVSACAARRPERAEPLLAKLIEAPEQDCAWPAMHGLQKIAERLQPGTLEAVLRVVRADVHASASALGVLAKGGPDTPGARDAVFGLLRKHARARPLSGPLARECRLFTATAETAAKLWPSEPEVLERVLAWLDAAPSVRLDAGEKVGWYDLRDALKTALRLAPESDRVRETMVRLAKFAAKAPRNDQYAAEDLRRAIRAAANAMGDPPQLWKELATAKLARKAPAEEKDYEDPPPPPLPDFPKQGAAVKPKAKPAPTPVPVTKTLPAVLARELRAVLPRGARLAKVKVTDAPDEIAAAVDAAVTAARAKKKPRSLDDATALGALWGDALARASGWTWAHLVLGKHKRVCLVSPDRAHACAPLEYLYAQRTPGAEVTALLLFNMVVAGQLPPSAPGKLVRFG